MYRAQPCGKSARRAMLCHAPRVVEVGCLCQVTHWPTQPGCSLLLLRGAGPWRRVKQVAPDRCPQAGPCCLRAGGAAWFAGRVHPGHPGRSHTRTHTFEQDETLTACFQLDGSDGSPCCSSRHTRHKQASQHQSATLDCAFRANLHVSRDTGGILPYRPYQEGETSNTS